MFSFSVSSLCTLAIFLCRVSCANGSVVTPGVHPAVLADLKLYSQYSSAIYCDNNANTTRGSLIRCATGSCPEVEVLSAYYYGGFLNVGYYTSAAFLAVDPINRNLVLTFRGAEKQGVYSTYITDMISCKAVCEKCNCYHGFYETWLEIRSLVIPLVKSALKDYPHFSLVITGHSLGAAQAGYAAAEFRANGTAASMYTYAQQHLGDIEFAKFVTAQGNNYRVSHTDDNAPHLPFNNATGKTYDGYKHISPEYWIYEDRNSAFSVAKDQIKVISGFDSLLGNQGASIEVSGLVAHVEYFQPQMASCYVVLAKNGTEIPAH